MTKWLGAAVVLWLTISIANAGVYHDSNLTWQTLETEHFRIHFHQGEEKIVRDFIPIAEQIYSEVSAFLNWHTIDKTDVVLTDEYDISNGFARVFPRNNIVLRLSAPDELNSLEDHNGWLELVFRHEFLHIAHLDKVHGLPDSFQSVFGRHPLLFPNAYQPRWIIEGIATYIETDNQLGIGRGQSSYFDMFMRVETLDDFKQVRRVNQPIASWPAGYLPYLYGVKFFNFIRDRYGEEKIKLLVENYSDNLIPFFINSNSSEVVNRDIAQLWTEFNEYLHEKYDQPVAAIKQAGIRQGRAVTHDGYQAGPLQALDEKVYFVDFNGRTHPAIKVTDYDGNITDLLEVNQGARLALHVQQGILITQPEVCRNARVYYDIYRAGLDGRNLTRLTRCGRYRHAVWSTDGKQIIAAHNELGLNSLHLLNEKGELSEVLWQGKANEQIGHMTMSSSSGQLVATLWQQDRGWNLVTFDFANRQWRLLTNDGYIQAQPSFASDGKTLLYSSDEDGIYNVYQLTLETGEKSRLTNLVGGAFSPSMSAGRLSYIGYGKGGFDVYIMDEPVTDNHSTLTLIADKKDQETVQPVVASGESETGMATADTGKTYGRPVPYSGLSSLAPNWWSPDIFIDDQRTELGFMTSGNDALDRHRYDLTMAYDTKNSLTVGSFNYSYDGLWPIVQAGFERESNLYLNGSGNLARIRAEDRVYLGLVFPFLSFDEKIFAHAHASSEQEKDVWLNGVSALPANHEDMAGLALRYDSTHHYPLSVSRSEGRELRVIYEDTDAFGDSDLKGQVTVGEWREFIHYGSSEHVLAFRLVEGHGRNNSERFRLGGIQDDDTLLSVLFNGERSALFNKREYTLRGYDEGHAALRGRSMRLFSAEYRFPLMRIEHGFMAPPLGINQLHGTLFYDVGGVWNTGSGPDDYYAGTGLEINADLDLFYNFRVHAVLGFATGTDDVLGEDKVYFRIGSQF